MTEASRPLAWLGSVRAVLFDLDNTLYDHTLASRAALFAAAREFEETAALSPDVLFDHFTRHNDACWALAVCGEMTREELALARFERTLESFAVSGLEARRLSEAYLTLYRGQPSEVPGARATVLRLLESRPVGIVTNGFPDYVEEKLAAIGLAGRLHPVVVAERIEVMKPRPDCFLAAVERLALHPPEVLYVGDSPAVDVVGARGSGLRACWLNRLGAPWPDGADVPDVVIRKLNELPELLGGAGQPPSIPTQE
jgi:putative hydrolase of the HAD superfamily